jgi:DNA-binding Xre family transcriptional regulator
MNRSSGNYAWKLRPLMAARGLWKTSELVPLLAGEGVVLSAAQVYRLVAKTPERLSLATLAALCRILSCSPSDLIEIGEPAPTAPARSLAGKARPRRAEVAT